MKRLGYVCLPSLLLIAGCRIGPTYQRPTVTAPVAFKELTGSDEWKSATPSDQMLRGKWWEVFGDPLLNSLEEQVSDANFNVKVAEANFRQARALIDSNRATQYPVFGTTPAISQSDRGPNAGGRGATQQFTLPFTASWEADLWGRIRTNIENAQENAQFFAANLENVRLSLQSNVATNYFALLSVDMQSDILADTIQAYQTYLTLTNNRFRGGIASRNDVALAETQLFTAQALATDLRATRATLEHAIAVLTGRPPSALSIAHGKIASPPPEIPIALPSLLLERRPDVAAAERSMMVANGNIGLAQIAFYPTVSFSATAGLTSTALQNLLTWGSRVWSIGPSANQTIFDFGRRDALVQSAQATYDATVGTYRQTILTAFQQVEDNLSTLRVLAEEASQQSRAVASAEQSLQISTERYKAGTDSYLTVITTQSIALNNERNAVTLLQRRMAAAVNLIVALGGGWDVSAIPTIEQLRSPDLADPAKTKTVAQPKQGQNN